MNLPPHQYQVFGLNVASEVQLSKLSNHSFDCADVIIKLAKVNINVPNGIKLGKFSQISSDDYLLDIPEVAKYYVQNGKTITIEKNAGISDLLIQAYLFGTVFANILQYRGYLVLHGSAIKVDDRAIIFSGKSGAGKSTTAAAFIKRGYTLLTDDVVALSPNVDGTFSLVSGPPRLKLWQHAIDELGAATAEMVEVTNKMGKYEIPVTRADNIGNIGVSAFYELNSHQADDIQLIRADDGVSKLRLLMKNTYRYKMLKPMNKLAEHLKFCTDFSKQINMFKVYRPENIFAIDELVASIENNLHS